MNRKNRSRNHRVGGAWLFGVALLAPVAVALADSATDSGTPAATAQSDDTLQEVVVTGIRYSLTKALETKRKEVDDVEVIEASDIGKLPDKNVADAVQRLPGVNTASAAGEPANS